MSKDFYYPLKNSVNILIIDDELHQIDFYESMLAEHPLYKIHKASNAREAESILKSSTPIHLCTLDLGINDLKSDEYYLLKQHGFKIPFVVISGSTDIERAFTASNLGAAGLIAKPVIMTESKYWTSLHTAFLDNTILPVFPSNANQLLHECRTVLQKELPDSVSEWAAKVSVTDSYLRKIWGECTSSSPKMILFLYRLYKEAFTWFDAHCIADFNNTPCTLSQPDLTEHRKTLNYYLQNKTEFDMIRDHR